MLALSDLLDLAAELIFILGLDGIEKATLEVICFFNAIAAFNEIDQVDCTSDDLTSTGFDEKIAITGWDVVG
jgi:hypothetical protein